jgi:hypothetical protein
MDKANKAASLDNPNKAASLDNPNRRKVAKVRLKQNRTTRTAIVSVALHSLSTAMFIDHWKSRLGRDFLLFQIAGALL